MRDELRMRWPVLLVTLILLIGIAIGLVWNSKNQKAESERLQILSDNYNDIVRPLWNERREIQDRLNQLDAQSALDDLDLSTVIFVITEEMADARKRLFQCWKRPDIRVILPMTETSSKEKREIS